MASAKLRIAAILLAAGQPAIASAQVLAPPLLEGQEKIAADLVTSIKNKDVNGYGNLLADNVQVYEDTKLVASSKKQWLAAFGAKLGAYGVRFEIPAEYLSTGRVLLIEYFNSIASWGRSPPPACCWGYDASAYDIKDGKIYKITRLRGGDVPPVAHK